MTDRPARFAGLGLCSLLLLSTPLAAGPKPKTVEPDQPSARQATPPPKGFIEMKVAGVMPTREGNAVMLADPAETVALPIWIGDAEAFSIQMRLDRRRFQRPLTHDLLDNIMRELGGRLVKIQVDDLKGNTFVGTVFIEQAGKVIEIDSRPSDAIALAVGNRVPIHVSQKVIDRVGIRKQDAEAKPKPQDKLLEDILKGDREEHSL
jgi:bifunctional DNase/RNase